MYKLIQRVNYTQYGMQLLGTPKQCIKEHLIKIHIGFKHFIYYVF